MASNNTVVFALQPDQHTTQFAVYTIAADGTLSTTNTAANLTTVANGGAYAFDPSGTWLAVGSATGLSVYKLANGQLTLASTLAVQNGPPTQLLWDADGHIYWYGPSCCGEFLGFSVSSSGQLTQLPATGPEGTLGAASWTLAVQQTD